MKTAIYIVIVTVALANTIKKKQRGPAHKYV